MATSPLSHIITRDAPDSVQYDLSKPNQVTITLPVGSTWSSGLHWHENHVEYLQIIKGSVRVTLGSEIHIITAGKDAVTEPLKVDRNIWHEWSRADSGADIDGEDVIVVERTDPEDGQKAVFFYNLNGVILKAQRLPKPPYVPRFVHGMLMNIWVTLSLLVIFHDLDNIPVFVNFGQAFAKRGFTFKEKTPGQPLMRVVDWFWSHAVLLAASWIGWALEIRAVHEEYTPMEARGRWLMSEKGERRYSQW